MSKEQRIEEHEQAVVIARSSLLFAQQTKVAL